MRVALGSAGLVLVIGILCYPGIGDWCSFSPDGFEYLATARTLVETGRFPQYQLQPPPGFPLIIAPLLMLDAPLLGLRILFAVCWAITGMLTYHLHRRELGEGLGWIAGLLVAGSPVLLMLTTTPLSEPVFIAVMTGVVVMAAAWHRRPVRRWWEPALGGLLTTAAFMLRSMGIVLLPIMAVTLVCHRSQPVRRRVLWLAVFAFCSIGPWAAWRIRQSIFPPGLSYMNNWTTAREVENTSATGLALQWQRFSRFGALRLESIKEATVPKDLAWRAFKPPLDVLATWLIGGFFIAVALARFVRFRGPVDVCVLLTLGLVSLWPWDEGVRLVAPLIPIFVGYPLWIGLACWRRKGSRQWERVALASALVVVLAVQVGGMRAALSRLPNQRKKAMRRYAAMSALADWHGSHTPAGAPWVGIAPDRHNSKLLLLGAAHLSRRPVSVIDVREGAAIDLQPAGESCVFVHHSLWESGAVPIRRDYTSIAKVGEFVVFQPLAEGP